MSIRRIYREFGRELIRAHERAASLPTPNYGERALERENSLCRLLNARIPGRYHASRGFVLLEDDVHDQQIDGIVYDRFHFGARSNLEGNVVALAKSVAVVIFETINLNRDKFRGDLERVLDIKLRLRGDRSFDPVDPAGGALIGLPAAYVIAYEATDHRKQWDVASEYAKWLRASPEHWNNRLDGILILRSGEICCPGTRLTRDRKSDLPLLLMPGCLAIQPLGTPPNTELGLLSGRMGADAPDFLFEMIRFFLSCFKTSPVGDNEKALLRIPANDAWRSGTFMSCTPRRRSYK